jgi:type II secretory pathway pseudopilin PulG
MRNWRPTVRPHWIEIVLAIAVVVVAAAVGTAQVYIYIRQANIMQTQATIADRQLTEMKEDRRAWVSPFALIPTIAANVPVTLGISVENSGQSPATSVVHKFNGQTIDVPSGVRVSATWIAPQLPPNDSCTNGKIVEGTKIIYPSTVTGYQYRLETLTDPGEMPIVNALVAGTKTLYIQGCFTYVTAVRPRYSKYCFFLIPNADGHGHWDYGYCPTGNDGN